MVLRSQAPRSPSPRRPREGLASQPSLLDLPDVSLRHLSPRSGQGPGLELTLGLGPDLRQNRSQPGSRRSSPGRDRRKHQVVTPLRGGVLRGGELREPSRLAPVHRHRPVLAVAAGRHAGAAPVRPTRHPRPRGASAALPLRTALAVFPGAPLPAPRRPSRLPARQALAHPDRTHRAGPRPRRLPATAGRADPRTVPKATIPRPLPLPALTARRGLPPLPPGGCGGMPSTPHANPGPPTSRQPGQPRHASRASRATPGHSLGYLDQVKKGP